MLAERFNLFKYRGNWKYPDPLIVQPNMLPNKDGDNINGPSLIKVPNWVKNPLGKYYLYFSHHDGKYIRMAYSNKIEGPYISNPRNPIITSRHLSYDNWVNSTGHGDIIELDDGRNYMVLLGIRNQIERGSNMGRETFLAPVSW